MVDSANPSLLSSPISTKHHLPIKSIDTTKHILNTRRSLNCTIGFSILIFIACTFLLASTSSTHFFHSSPFWLNSFIKSTTNSNPNISYKQHYFPSFFSNFPYSSPSLSHNPNIPSQVNNTGVDLLSQDSNNATSMSNDSRNYDKNLDLLEKQNETKKYVMQEKNSTRNDKALIPKRKRNYKKWVEMMRGCNLFDGKWVRDDYYPLYKPGSCPYIDEPFNCFVNGRKDNAYEKYRWQPNHCNIPRLNGKYMLELLRGKRMVFVGDSLNRNMWESMLCILQNEAPNKNNVFEVSGRQEFRTEGSYSFMFQDYNFTVEFFRTTFLVQEWESEINGTKKETLRIDRMESAAEKYKDADVLVFNTGHWWTHEKTSSGKGYYQEGEHVYDELNVDIAFRKSMSTWANWVEANVDPLKTLVLFRGYSVSHFRGGEWNSGGHCDGETEPLKEEKEFETDPPMVKIMESVLEKMKAPVFYLNVTRMTNFRKDAHPSFFREINSSEEDKKSGVRIQDCSHWCLPGVPDMWNQIIYAQLLFKHREKLLQQHLLAQRSP